MKYIKNVTTLEELKKVYKKLALKMHPDCGGDEEEMKVLNNEYDSLFEQLKNTHKNAAGEFYTKETNETPNQWIDIINQLLSFKMENVLIEVMGSFLWVSGNTKPYKEELKSLKMRWSKNKQAWYLSPEGYRKKSKKTMELDDIRDFYGSKIVKKTQLKIAQ